MAPKSAYTVCDSGEAAIKDNPNGKYLLSIAPLDVSSPKTTYTDFSINSFTVLDFVLLTGKIFLFRVMSFKKIAT